MKAAHGKLNNEFIKTNGRSLVIYSYVGMLSGFGLMVISKDNRLSVVYRHEETLGFAPCRYVDN